jgi:gelsolin
MAKFGGSPKCTACGKAVYANEQLSVEGAIFHKVGCFKCTECSQTLKLGNFASMEGKYYCKPHFKQLFLSKGNYSEGFGSEKPTAKWDGKGKDPSKPADDVGQAKLEDSNVEKIGSKEDRAVKKGAAQTEDAWAGAGKKVGVEVWRVENHKAKAVGKKADFGVKRWPQKDFGKFWDGDSYIVLVTRKKLDEEGKPTDAFEWDLHFWLGQDSTQDEMGVAAYKTVELDTLLDDGPVQYREVQNYETEKFLAVWEGCLGGMTVMDGGIDGGFTHVEVDKYEPRLFRVTRSEGGSARVRQVKMDFGQICQSDCFVLDLGMKLCPFKGTGANKFEESKMREFIRQLDNDRGGKPEQLPDNCPEFFAHFGVDKDVEIREESEPEVRLVAREPVLYRLSLDGDAGDGFSKISDAPLSKSMLVSEDAFVVDAGDQIFAWVGKDANPAEKKEIMVKAMHFLASDKSRPQHTPITRIWEGQVVAPFEAAFTA